MVRRMATDLDPVFVRALKLLHSRSKDAVDQLKQMADEAIAQRRGELALKKLEDSGGKFDDVPPRHRIKREYSDVDKKRDVDKKSLERLKDDLASLTDDTAAPAKKPKLESSSSSESKWRDRDQKDQDRPGRDSGEGRSNRLRESGDSHKQTAIKEDPSWLDNARETTKTSSKRSVESSESSEKRFILGGGKAGSDDSDDNEDTGSYAGLDAEQFATDVLDLTCVVCKQLDITPNNQLLDCQECHCLYHQECHRPPVDKDVNDPRFVWYCSKCSKNMKKMVKAQKPKANQSSSGKEREKEIPPQKAFKPEVSLQPFKRFEASKSGKEPSSGSGSSSSRPYTGLASLAANLSSKTHGDPAKSSREAGKSGSSGGSGSGKVDNSKGLGFLFKPDAHKITTKSSSSSSEKGGLYKMASSKSGSVKSGSSPGSSSSSSSSSSKTSGAVSLLGKSSSSSSSSSSAAAAKAAAVATLQKSSSGSSGSSSAGASASASSTSNTGKMSSLMSADKKVQMMKKKAAARAAERKSLR